MLISVKDFENNELFTAEIVDYVQQDGNIFNVVIPFGEYPAAADIETTDLLVIRVTTDKLNYQGYGRIFEVYPSPEGSLLRIKYDGAWDVH